MKGQKKKQNGITLIALVISIIVMLILAGVSINALMGDNGILKQAQFASFMSEMAAVEEAVQLWGAEHYDDEDHSIPAKGAVQQEEIDNSERLGGEIGYYRTWSRTNTMPEIPVTTQASSFNSSYLAELVFFPGGVEDLYYLDNNGLNLNSDKKYVIDAENSMIYSVRGISLNGVRCYSLEMAKAVMNGTYDEPNFIASEVSGSQASGGVKAAGNTGPEYFINEAGQWTDSEGNVVSTQEEARNENYNPYGFKLIASPSSNNVFKLYNNGELYGKGIKGIQLNTSETEMNNINQYKWKELTVSSTIGSYKKMYASEAGLFLIDNNDNLWSINTEYGLTDEQRIEYTGRSWVKLDLGKDSNGNAYKASKVFGTASSVYVVTTTNKLLGTGNNRSGQLGTGDKVQRTTFVEISGIPDPSKITSIRAAEYSSSGNGNTIVKCVDPTETDTIGNHFYFAGVVGYGTWGHGLSQSFTSTTLTEIYKGVSGQGDNIRNTLNEILIPHYESIGFWFLNGDFEFIGWSMYCSTGKLSIPKVVDVRYSQSLKIFKCDNNGTIEYYGTNRIDASYGVTADNKGNSVPKKITIPEGVNIVDFQIINGSSVFFLASNGDVYGLGSRYYFDVNDYAENPWSYTLQKITTISNISSFYGNVFGNSNVEHRIIGFK